MLASSSANAAGPSPFVEGSWSQLRDAHKGRPVIVHFWGMTCGPCLAELPKWGEFAQKNNKADLVLVEADPFETGAGRETSAAANVLAKANLGAVERWAFAS